MNLRRWSGYGFRNSLATLSQLFGYPIEAERRLAQINSAERLINDVKSGLRLASGIAGQARRAAA